MEKLKSIEFAVVENKLVLKEKLIAGGNEYFLEDSLSFERWNYYEELAAKLTLAKSVKEIFKELRSAWDAANEQQFGNVCIILYNLMKGVQDLDDPKRIPIAFEMCALFINKQGEDHRYITPQLIKEKYNDFSKEGYDMKSFFTLAIAFTPDFTNVFETVSHDTLLNQKTNLKKAIA